MTATDITNLIVALSTLITAVTLLVKTFPLAKKVEAVSQIANATQDIVNGKNDNLINRTVQLEQALQTNQIPVPPDPNVTINQTKAS